MGVKFARNRANCFLENYFNLFFFSIYRSKRTNIKASFALNPHTNQPTTFILLEYTLCINSYSSSSRPTLPFIFQTGVTYERSHIEHKSGEKNLVQNSYSLSTPVYKYVLLPSKKSKSELCWLKLKGGKEGIKSVLSVTQRPFWEIVENGGICGWISIRRTLSIIGNCLRLFLIYRILGEKVNGSVIPICKVLINFSPSVPFPILCFVCIKWHITSVLTSFNSSLFGNLNLFQLTLDVSKGYNNISKYLLFFYVLYWFILVTFPKLSGTFWQSGA